MFTLYMYNKEVQATLRPYNEPARTLNEASPATALSSCYQGAQARVPGVGRGAVQYRASTPWHHSHSFLLSTSRLNQLAKSALRLGGEGEIAADLRDVRKWRGQCCTYLQRASSLTHPHPFWRQRRVQIGRMGRDGPYITKMSWTSTIN